MHTIKRTDTRHGTRYVIDSGYPLTYAEAVEELREMGYGTDAETIAYCAQQSMRPYEF